MGPDPARCDRCGTVLRVTACAHCGTRFTARSPAARYCSSRCRVAAHRQARRG